MSILWKVKRLSSVHLDHNELQEKCHCIWRHLEPKGCSPCMLHGLVSIFLPQHSTSPPFLPPVLTYELSSWERWKFILHKQFVRWPLSESANQVANSDVDTCPFGTGMKTATHFLETIKHPVCEQQLSLNCNMGKT